MKRILLTGVSGVGKSATIVELHALGYKAVDVDGDDYSHWVEVSTRSDQYGSTVEPDRDWMWREDRIQGLLSTEDADILFLSGCAANMGKFLPQFDHVVLLSASKEVIIERLRTRTNNLYGRRPEETARVLDLIQTVEPMLRRVSGYEINTSAGMDKVVATVLRIAQSDK